MDILEMRKYNSSADLVEVHSAIDANSKIVIA